MTSVTHVTPDRLIVNIPIESRQLPELIKAWMVDCPMCIDKVIGWTPDDVQVRMAEHIVAAHEEELDEL